MYIWFVFCPLVSWIHSMFCVYLLVRLSWFYYMYCSRLLTYFCCAQLVFVLFCSAFNLSSFLFYRACSSVHYVVVLCPLLHFRPIVDYHPTVLCHSLSSSSVYVLLQLLCASPDPFLCLSLYVSASVPSSFSCWFPLLSAFELFLDYLSVQGLLFVFVNLIKYFSSFSACLQSLVCVWVLISSPPCYNNLHILTICKV